MKRMLFLLSALLPWLLTAQTVTTIRANSGITDDLIFDANGNLLGADYTGSAVFRVELPGTSVNTFSDGFNTPNGLALGPDGNYYMADNQGNKIYRIAPDGTASVFVDMYNPSGLIFQQGSDTLIATSYLGDRIVKISPDGVIHDWSKGGLLAGGPVGLCYDDAGRLYTGNFDDRRIIRILADGSQEAIGQAPTSGWLGFIDYANGYLYGTLYSTHKIFRMDLQGNASIILGSTAGNADGDATQAKFNAPNGILASSTGDTLYISDYNSSNLRMITGLNSLSATNEMFPEMNLQLYPNPVHDFLQVKALASGNLPVRLEVFNAVGQNVYRDSIEANNGPLQVQLDCSRWPAGSYQLLLFAGDGQVLSRWFVKSSGH
ncbi:MAG: T9SS type A sorting domain-containing protein [Lewinellaceae bacterium]|nr:T9SS type A sorting domain-containing protein [Lewinellaceae bacterium]